MEKNWNIDTIQSLDELGTAEIAEEVLNIKEHKVYFVDFKGYFGYSALVFKDGCHMYYANDYQLHHSGREKDWLRNWYIETMNHKLFTEEEMNKVTNYDDYKAKEYYLRNYYSQQKEHISMFFIGSDAERDKREKITSKMFFDPVGYAYYNDKEFVKHHVKLFNTLVTAMENKKNDFEYWTKAFLKEMYNHEYGINWDADIDTLSAFGNIPYKRGGYKDLTEIFDELGFNEVQRNAYVTARKTYYKEQEE